MSGCTLCPRRCGVQRPLSLADGGSFGVCGMGRLPVVARAAAHFGEEPCISGTRGSGTVFFSGCSLQCVFCQNREISADRFGKELTVPQLREAMERLVALGVHNINLVNPTHFVPAIAEALAQPLPVPVVYNTGGYDSVETLRLLEGKVSVYLPDFKYADPARAKTYSGAADYPAVALAAIKEMVRQVGPPQFDGEGLLRRGVIVRHLVLPGGLADTKAVIDRLADTFAEGEILVSLMSQYTPCRLRDGYPELNRRLTTREYTRAVEHLQARGITAGYTQAIASATPDEIPAFDLTGI